MDWHSVCLATINPSHMVPDLRCDSRDGDHMSTVNIEERRLVPRLWAPCCFLVFLLCIFFHMSSRTLVFLNLSLACGGRGWRRMKYKRWPKPLVLPKLAVAAFQHQQANTFTLYFYFVQLSLFLWLAVCERVLLRYYSGLCNRGIFPGGLWKVRTLWAWRAV